jgi:hypothetical protein
METVDTSETSYISTRCHYPKSRCVLALKCLIMMTYIIICSKITSKFNLIKQWLQEAMLLNNFFQAPLNTKASAEFVPDAEVLLNANCFTDDVRETHCILYRVVLDILRSLYYTCIWLVCVRSHFETALIFMLIKFLKPNVFYL